MKLVITDNLSFTITMATVLHSQSKSRMSLYLSVNDKLSVITSFMKYPPGVAYTVEPLYNEVLGTMKITLLYQVSRYIRVKNKEI